MSASVRPAATTRARDSRRPGISSRFGSIVSVTRSSELMPRRFSSAAISPAVTSITSGAVAIGSPLLPSIRILQPHDIILAQVAAGLHLDQGQRDAAGVVQAMHAAQRQVDALVLAHQER